MDTPYIRRLFQHVSAHEAIIRYSTFLHSPASFSAFASGVLVLVVSNAVMYI
jgi:hypothetical protein